MFQDWITINASAFILNYRKTSDWMSELLTCSCSQVVSSISFSFFGLLNCFDRNSQDFARPQQLSGKACRDVILPHMHSICTHRERNVDSVVDDQD